MARIIVNLPAELAKQYGYKQEQFAKRIAEEARKQAELKGIKFPKRMAYGGAYGAYVYFPINSNAVRDVVIGVLNERKLAFELY